MTCNPMATKISINGKVYSSKSGNITINNDKIYMDDMDVTPSEKEIFIIVNGDIEKLTAPGANEILVNGDANKIITTSGDVTIGERVTNDVKTTSGNVKVFKSITGDVKTMSGDVRATSILGKATTMSGNILGHRR